MNVRILKILALFLIIFSMNAGAQSANPFGVYALKSDNVFLNMDAQINVVKSLGLPYIRTSATMINGWDFAPAFKKITAAGLKVVLNINYNKMGGNIGATPFPSDMNAYKAQLTSMLNSYSPELIVIENEEANPEYHSDGVQAYLTELSAAIDVAHSKNLKITNGGLGSVPLTILVYRYYLSQGQNDKAADFARRVFSPKVQSDLPNLERWPKMNEAADATQQLLQAYATMNIDYVNFHWYEPIAYRGSQEPAQQAASEIESMPDQIDTRALAEVVDYIQNVTHKKAMTNEIGMLRQSPQGFKQFVAETLSLGMPYVIWFSGDSGIANAVAFNNADGSLRENGVALHDFVAQNFPAR